MSFKNFLNESFDSKNVEAGDILSSLETLNDNIDNIKRKNLIDILNGIVSDIIPLLKIKINKNLALILQKIAFAIKNDIEENNDFKETIESSIYELKNYFQKNNILLNKPIKNPKTDNIADPVEKQSKYILKNSDLQSPEETVDSYSPPLAGNGEKTFDTI